MTLARQLKQYFMISILGLALGCMVVTQVACTSAQVQNVVNKVNQYLPIAVSVASDIIAMLPLLVSQVNASESAAYITDAQGFEDAVNTISSDAAAYLSSKAASALGKLADAVNAAKATVPKLLADVHVFNVQLQAKITAYVNLASTVFTTLASVVGAPTAKVAMRALAAAPFNPAEAQAQLSIIRSMPM